MVGSNVEVIRGSGHRVHDASACCLAPAASPHLNRCDFVPWGNGPAAASAVRPVSIPAVAIEPLGLLLACNGFNLVVSMAVASLAVFADFNDSSFTCCGLNGSGVYGSGASGFNSGAQGRGALCGCQLGCVRVKGEG